MQEVLKSYKKTASLQKTADELKIAYAKVRKILITLGEYKTAFSQEVGKRRSMGKSIAEIATELNTSTNRVTAFLPYEEKIFIPLLNQQWMPKRVKSIEKGSKLPVRSLLAR